MRPLSIELRHVSALAAVAQAGSFNAAAVSLGYVQSAISQQIAQLERAVGQRLVERRRGTAAVGLTEAGMLLVGHFEKIVARLEAAQADLEALAAGRAGRLRVGVDEPTAARLMPLVLRVLGPRVEVEMEERRSIRDRAALVEAGELDLAFGDLPLPPGPFELRELLRDPFLLVAPTAWGLTEVTDLAELPLIRWGERDVEPALRARGIAPHFVCGAGSGTAVQAMVGAGLGAALLPRLAVNLHDDRTVALPAGELMPARSIALYWHREPRRPASVAAFVQAAVAAVPQLPVPPPTLALAA